MANAGDAIFEIDLNDAKALSKLSGFEGSVKATITKLEAAVGGLGSKLAGVFSSAGAGNGGGLGAGLVGGLQPALAAVRQLADADKAYWQATREDRARDKTLSSAYYAAIREDATRTRTVERTQAAEVAKVIKGISDAVATQRSVYQATGKDIEETKTRLETLKAAALQIGQSLAQSGTAGTGAMRQLATAAATAEGTIRTLDGGVARLGVGFSTANAFQQTFNQSLAQFVPFGTQFLSIGQSIIDTLEGVASGGEEASSGIVNAKIAGLGLAAVAGVALTVGAAFLDAGKAAGKFQTEIAFIATETNKSIADLKPVADGILSLSEEVGKSSTDLARGVYDIIGASVKGADGGAGALALLEVSSKAAVAGLTETKTATDVITSSLNAYGLEAKDAGAVSDILFKTVAIGKTTFKDLAEQLGDVLGIASTAKVSFGELNAGIAALTASGLQTPQAVTGLRQALENIIGPSVGAKRAAKELGIEFNVTALSSKGLGEFMQDLAEKTGGNITTLKRLFTSTEALNAVSNFISKDGLARLKSGLEDVAAASGETQGAFNKVAGTYEQATERFNAAWEALKINVGELALPSLTKLVNEAVEATRNLRAALGDASAKRLPEARQTNQQRGTNFTGETSDTAFSLYSSLSKQLDDLIEKRQRLRQQAEAGLFGKVGVKAARDEIVKLDKEIGDLQKRLIDLQKQNQKPAGKTTADLTKAPVTTPKTPPVTTTDSSGYVAPTPAQISQARELVNALLDAKEAGKGIVEAQLAVDKFGRANKGAAEAVRLVTSELSTQRSQAKQNANEAESERKKAEAEQKRLAAERKTELEKQQREAEARAKLTRDLNTDLKQLNAGFKEQVKDGKATQDQLNSYNESLNRVFTRAQDGGVALSSLNAALLKQANALRGAGAGAVAAQAEYDRVTKAAEKQALAFENLSNNQIRQARAALTAVGNFGLADRFGEELKKREKSIQDFVASTNKAAKTSADNLKKSVRGLSDDELQSRISSSKPLNALGVQDPKLIAYLDEIKRRAGLAADEAARLSQALQLETAQAIAGQVFAKGLDEADQKTRDLVQSVTGLSNVELARLAGSKQLLSNELLRVAVQAELKRRLDAQITATERYNAGLAQNAQAESNLLAGNQVSDIIDQLSSSLDGPLNLEEITLNVEALQDLLAQNLVPESLVPQAQAVIARVAEIYAGFAGDLKEVGFVPFLNVPELKLKPKKISIFADPNLGVQVPDGISVEDLARTANERKDALELVRREQAVGLATQEDVTTAAEAYQRALQAQIARLGSTSTAARLLKIDLANVGEELGKIYDPGGFAGGSPSTSDVLAGFGGTPDEYDAVTIAIENTSQASRDAREELAKLNEEKSAGYDNNAQIIAGSFALEDALQAEIEANGDNAKKVRDLRIELEKLRLARLALIGETGNSGNGSPSASDVQSGFGQITPEQTRANAASNTADYATELSKVRAEQQAGIKTFRDVNAAQDRYRQGLLDQIAANSDNAEKVRELQLELAKVPANISELVVGLQGIADIATKIAQQGRETVGGQVAGQTAGVIGAGIGIGTSLATGNALGVISGVLDLFSDFEGALNPLLIALEPLAPVFTAIGSVLSASLGATAPFIELVANALGLLAPILSGVIVPIFTAVGEVLKFFINAVSSVIKFITFGLVDLGQVGTKTTPTSTKKEKEKTDTNAGRAFGEASNIPAPSISLPSASSANVAFGGGQIVAAEVNMAAATLFSSSTGTFNTAVGVFARGAEIIYAAGSLFAAGAQKSRGLSYGDAAL